MPRNCRCPFGGGLCTSSPAPANTQCAHYATTASAGLALCEVPMRVHPVIYVAATAALMWLFVLGTIWHAVGA